VGLSARLSNRFSGIGQLVAVYSLHQHRGNDLVTAVTINCTSNYLPTYRLQRAFSGNSRCDQQNAESQSLDYNKIIELSISSAHTVYYGSDFG
jgi:hypothetical protein